MIRKITKTLEVLRAHTIEILDCIDNVEIKEADYKTDNILPTEGFKPHINGEGLLGYDKHYWLRTKFRTPSVDENKYIVLKCLTGYEGQTDTIKPQCMVFVNGKNRQAMDTYHTDLRLDADTDYDIYVYYYTGTEVPGCGFKICLGVVNEPALMLYYDMSVPFAACKDVYIENSYEYAVTMKVLDRACNYINLNYPFTPEYYVGIEKARELLKSEYYDKVCGNNCVTVSCIGHTHIDVAWLWTLEQTKEKIERSMSTVIELMKWYPEYKFMMSQPQLFRYLSEANPEMYDEIKNLVKQGRFELEGAMWLEADCNLTSGESLVRQILHGKRFLKKEFDIESRVLWLPDVFGYSAALPQILKKSGVEHFITSKISWNDTNTMPYDTFIWQGLDGSEILTDFITAQDYKRGGEFTNGTTYVGQITPSMVAGTWNRYQQKEHNDRVMLVYGWGDGGGGPTTDMLEQQRRLAYGLPGMPKTEMTTLAEHLRYTEEKFECSCKETGRTPKWVGELYLEFHRGVYTSMAKNKRYNRFSEMLMQRLESLAVINEIFNGKRAEKEDLYNMWDVILLNQFHDIIPGSSIREVYETSHKQYEDLFQKGSEMSHRNLEMIANNVKTDGGVFVYNSLGFERKGTIYIDGKTYETDIIPSMGWAVINPQEKVCKVEVCGNVAENDFYILEIDSAGRIVRLFDKTYDREVFKEGAFANEFRIYEDMPIMFENWELASYYGDKCLVLDSDAEISIVTDGDRKGFKTVRRYHDSVITQYIYLYSDSRRIDVKNDIDWNCKQQVLKIHFPINVYTTKATFDVQFGSVERNTHKNTTWDAAKFEVCGQKWVDVSDCGYGVSILNDCKYGYGTDGSDVSLTVLKCGLYPNNQADQGKHEFVYSIYPHKGDYRVGGTVRESYNLNQPLLSTRVLGNQTGQLTDSFSLISCDADNVVIETLKPCEDESSTYIVRMYETGCGAVKTKINFGCDITTAWLCDMMENNTKTLNVTGNSIGIEFGAYEIITLKFKL